MDGHFSISNRYSTSLSVILLLLLCIASPAFSGWLKMDPPPDVDKTTHGHKGCPTCWLAAAANMLAGAGYGTGAGVQARADNIYNQLVANYGTASSGWADVAISWWLQSANNTWPNNPYVDVTVYGNKDAVPWLHNPQGGGFGNTKDDAAMFIANELRRCQMLGMSISWGANTGHVFSVWGDNNSDANQLTSNPSQVTITDSDGMEFTGDTVTYTYTQSFVGWWLNYNGGPFIKHVLTLCPQNDPNYPATTTSKHVNSYRVCNSLSGVANGLHHTAGANVEILTYLCTIDWQTANAPNIVEQPPTRYNVCFAWDVSDNPVPVSSCVTITDTLTLPYSSTMTVKVTPSNTFLYNPTPPDDPCSAVPDFEVGLSTNELTGGPSHYEPDITGGYVVVAFDLYADVAGTQTVSEHRMCFEYEYFQDPENHELTLTSLNITEPRWVGNFRFGHSYGLLEGTPLWDFAEWTAATGQIVEFASGTQVYVPLALQGVRPYPKGEDYIQPTPQRCGDPGTVYLPQDLNVDCRVNFTDFAVFAQGWMVCTDPEDLSCIPY